MSDISSVTAASPSNISPARGTASDDLRRYAAILSDETGRFSDDDKLKAWSEINSQWSALPNASQADQAAINQAVNSSTFMGKMRESQNSLIKSFNNNASTSSSSSKILEMNVASYDALPPDQKRLVEPIFNGQTGDQWKAFMLARAGLAKVAEDAASGLIKAGDPRISQARALDDSIEGKAVGAADLDAWTQNVQAFLYGGGSSPAFTIDLSDEARTYLNRNGDAGRR